MPTEVLDVFPALHLYVCRKEKSLILGLLELEK